MQIVNFIVNEFPKPEWWKENPRENTGTKVPKVWKNFAQANFDCVT